MIRMRFNISVILLALVLLSGLNEVCSQDIDLTKLKGPYLGQKPPGKTPEVFAPNILSIEDESEIFVSFHPTGNEVFVSKVVPGTRDYYLVSMKFDGEKWSAPERPSFASKFIDTQAVFSSSGKYVFFNSYRPLSGFSEGKRSTWFIDYTSNDLKPKLLPLLFKDPGALTYITSTLDDKIYFSSTEGIFSSVKTGNGYEAPALLGPNINAPTEGRHPFIASDESYLIFDAVDRSNGQGGNDLYISFRKRDSTWSPAIHLGNQINSSANEIGASVTRDGKYLFFCSKKNGKWDIYWVDAGFIEELKPKD